MISKILEHMNNEHKDILPLYVKYFNNRSDVTEGTLVDVTEESMKIIVNNGEEVIVNFTEKTPLDKVHMEMVKMAKIAREKLGVPLDHSHKNQSPNEHKEEEKLKVEINEFIGNFKSVILGTLTENSDPTVSYAPFLKYLGGNYIFISDTGEHFHNLKINGKLEVLFIEDEEKSNSISLRKRVKYKAKVEFLEKNEQTEKILDEFEKIDMVIKMTRKMKDFSLVKVTFENGRYVKGPGKAFDITKDKKIIAVTQDMSGHRQ